MNGRPGLPGRKGEQVWPISCTESIVILSHARVCAWASSVLFSVFCRETLELLELQEPLGKRDSWAQRYMLDNLSHRGTVRKNHSSCFAGRPRF